MSAAAMHPAAAAYWQRRWDEEAQRRLPMSRPRWDCPVRTRPTKMQGETRRKPGQRADFDWAGRRDELWSGTLEQVARLFSVTEDTIRRARYKHAPPATMARPLGVGVGRNVDWRSHVAALWSGEVEVVAVLFGVTGKVIRGARKRNPRPSQ